MFGLFFGQTFFGGLPGGGLVRAIAGHIQALRSITLDKALRIIDLRR